MTLGDVADVVSADRHQVDALATIELFPAPSAGRPRFLRAQDLQEILAVRQVNLTEHQFTGSSQVVVTNAGTEAPPGHAPSRRQPSSAERLLSEAIARYLKQHAAANQSWNATVKLDEGRSRSILESRQVSIHGGRAPWTGNQQFEVTVESPGEPTTFTVAAQIGSLPPIVTTVVPLAKGAIIRDGNVRLVAATTDDLTTDAAHSIEEVVGKETKLAIAPGMPIPEQAVRRQILVHRGDLIMVCADCGDSHPRRCPRQGGRWTGRSDFSRIDSRAQNLHGPGERRAGSGGLCPGGKG